MLVVLKRGTSAEGARAVVEALEARGLSGRLLESEEKPLIHVVEGESRRASRILRMDAVEALLPTSGPRIRREGRAFFPYHFVNWASACLLVLGLLVAAAGFVPPGIGEELDAYGPVPEVATTWYLRPARVLLTEVPFGWMVLLGICAFLFVLPLVDRTRGESRAARLPFVFLSLALAAGWVLLSLA